MAEQKNEIAKSFSDGLMDMLISVEDGLSSSFNKTRFVQNSMAVLNEHPELAKINKQQLQLGLLKGAFLSLDYSAKDFFLIPYGNSVQFQMSYQGIIKYVKKYAIRPIKEIYAKCVREGDVFEEKIVDGKPTINFFPKSFSNGKIMGAFAICEFADGGLLYETMSTEDMENVRANYSKAANSKAWKTSTDTMYMKTVLKRLCKNIEVDFETIEMRKAWEDGSDFDTNRIKSQPETEVVDVFANDPSKPIEVFDTTATEVADDEQLNAECKEVFG